MIIDDDIYAFIEHHGIKGMKWGVRNEERSGFSPRSVIKKIGDSNQSKNTERQAMLKARAAKGEVRVAEIMDAQAKLPKSAIEQHKALTYQKNKTQQQVQKDLEKAKNPPSRGLTSTQKKVLVGAGVAAVIIGGAYLAKKYDINDLESAGAAIRRGQSQLKYGSTFKKNEAFAQKMGPDEVLKNVVKGINPNYGVQGGQMNCRRCTMAYELRRRGMDVVATTSPVGYGQGETGLVNALVKGDKNFRTRSSLSANAAMDNNLLGQLRYRVSGDNRTDTAERDSVPFLKDLASTLAGKPNGARGEAVFNQGSFAHSLQWEIFDGVPHLFDAQKGQHFPVTDDGLKSFIGKWGPNYGVELTRLDNVDLDLAYLSRWAENS